MAPTSSSAHRIDVHHHILPPDYLSSIGDMGVTEAIGIKFPKWRPETSIGVMDDNGISFSFTSVSTPGVFFGDQAAANGLARRCNEYSARLMSEHPTRFGAFSVLPLPDLEDQLPVTPQTLFGVNKSKTCPYSRVLHAATWNFHR